MATKSGKIGLFASSTPAAVAARPRPSRDQIIQLAHDRCRALNDVAVELPRVMPAPCELIADASPLHAFFKLEKGFTRLACLVSSAPRQAFRPPCFKRSLSFQSTGRRFRWRR